MKTQYLDFSSRSICDLNQNDDGSWAIARICVPVGQRGHGHGSRLLNRVLRDADVMGVVLELTIAPYGAMTFEQLRAWYERRGFETIDSITWARQPRKCDHDLVLRTPHLWDKWECIGTADNLEYRNCPICWTTLTLYNYGHGPIFQNNVCHCGKQSAGPLCDEHLP